MRGVLRYAAAAALLSTAAFAESWTGVVVDSMCKAKEISGHIKQCALSPRCSGSGFGLAFDDGKFIKFDEGGNTKALAALKASRKDTDLKAKVTGTLKGDVIQVDTIEMQ